MDGLLGRGRVGVIGAGRLVRRSGRLRRGAACVAIAAALVVAALWGLSGSRVGSLPAASVGEDVRLGDGALRVERVGDEEIGAMPMKMSGPGMTEPGSAGKEVHIPHGMRRLGMDITVSAPASSSGVRVQRGDFRLAADGHEGVAPVGDDMTRSLVPAGTSLSANLAFNVPKATKKVQLLVRGAARPISLTLGAPAPSSSGGHDHH
jgi:hypothetical protein